ncbi:hypothetical protein COT94_04300 [Candidatus Falkowbacteria bacterium CG10_big_fil_rev_8_21_14_0_10_37_14]|uniref:NIF system FeS cluster assembly NifU C-terminal domain-containing protein n=1 Tax=Candidatus Falkowbacteria bacterium CG10_big_fil_rev_8_21_14_0_10_37_14 TaxID=1974561 RepID=A0A2M6WSL6_9BACT|nr:NifU family protein [Candidatus Falkowbacteria bacterium]PIT95813.1 MAG: hypothetical protein COT94_04300 [Candidatus Falkowbacteria bacterium CG10_big_fil_rev_8_21_14_0_10_37_14]
MEEKIKIELEKLRPALQMDGGDVVFVSFAEGEGVLYLALQGMCSHCPMSSVTLKNYIESELVAVIPEIKEVRSA